jgi:hypothetical protein
MGFIHDTEDPKFCGLHLETRRESFVLYGDRDERIELDYAAIGAVRLLLATAELRRCDDPAPVEPTAVKTPEEIAELKRQWIHDGCWDIEDTEGFEAHRDELVAWRTEHEAKFEVACQKKAKPILDSLYDSRWERAALAFISSGDDPRQAIANADEFIALVHESWVQ